MGNKLLPSQVEKNEQASHEDFWNGKFLEEKDLIAKSPIFIRKNVFVYNVIKKISGRLLDIGFGYAFIEELFSKKLDIQVYGIDISTDAVKYAKKYLKGRFYRGDVCKANYPKNFFSCVLALDILEHIPKDKLASLLLKIYRSLKSSGIIIVSVPLNESRTDTFRNRHLIRFTENSLIASLMRTGYKVQKVKKFSSFKNMFFAKTLINNMLKIRNPNLLIVVAKK